MIKVINYEGRFQADFKRLNLYWLDKYNLTESHDLEILDDPEGKVIAGGGCIFLAIDKESVVGTAGLAKEQEGVFELVKMVVDPRLHGQGIGKMLLNRCMEEAIRLKARKIFLFSNSQLITALKMYEKYGFRNVAVTNSPMLTADIKMEFIL